MLKKIRIENFKCLRDTMDLEVRPLTLLVGPNSSGKSSILQAILALKQTVESGDMNSPLILKDYIDLGSYKDVVFGHNMKNDIKISFEDTNKNKWSVIFSALERGRTAGKIFVKSLEFSPGETDSLLFSEKKVSVPSPQEVRVVKERDDSSYEIMINNEIIPAKYDLKKFYFLYPTGKIEISSKEGIKLLYPYFVITAMTESLFSHVYHIGPLRHEPERVYSASGASPQSVGRSGQWTIDLIQYEEEIRRAIQIWLEKFSISREFALKELKKGSKRYEVVLKDYFTSIDVNLADVGFGTSQILPIIVQGFTSPPQSTLLIEQPEIHLHPKAQCTMGDLLVDIVRRKNLNLIIETHSDLLIQRVCKHILLKEIRPDDIIIYYFEPGKEGVIVKPITVNENAQFENFPEGFFEERFEEALEHAELMS
jgi:predicted ATPase